jgi:hypothetical protein
MRVGRNPCVSSGLTPAARLVKLLRIGVTAVAFDCVYR